MTLVFEHECQHLAYGWLVLDDQDGGALMRTFSCLVPDVPRPPSRRAADERHLDGEDRAFARNGSNVDGVPQQVRQAFDDRETEAEPFAALARRIVELMELLENCRKFLFGNADTGIPDLDAQLVAAPSAAEQDLAFICVFHRVRQQIADHLLEQAGVAAHVEAARDDAPAEAMRRRVKHELGAQLLESRH